MGIILGWLFGAGAVSVAWYLWWDSYKRRPSVVQYRYVLVPYSAEVHHPKHRRETDNPYDHVQGEVTCDGMPQLSRGVRSYRNPLEMSALWPKA